MKINQQIIAIAETEFKNECGSAFIKLILFQPLARLNIKKDIELSPIISLNLSSFSCCSIKSLNVTTSGFDIHFLLNYKFVKHFPISIILNKYLPIWRLSASFQSENCVLTLNNAPMFSIKRFQFRFSCTYYTIDQHQWCILYFCFIISFVWRWI
jgi:hypothetical protein